MTTKNQFVNTILDLEEIFCLEDFGNFTMIINCIQSTKVDLTKKEFNKASHIRVYFLMGENERELIIKIKDLKKVYSFIKIYYNNNYINFLLIRSEEYNPNYILKRINDYKYIKGALGIHLKIKEFPLTNYILQEYQLNDNFADKIYILKNNGQNNQNQSTIINNYYTQIMIDKNIQSNENNVNNNSCKSKYIDNIHNLSKNFSL